MGVITMVTDAPNNPENERERRLKTEEVAKATQAMGYTVIEKWEC